MGWDKICLTANKDKNNHDNTNKRIYKVSDTEHPEHDAQPLPKQQSHFPGQIPQLYTQHDVTWYHLGQPVPDYVPSQLPVKINSIPAKTSTAGHL